MQGQAAAGRKTKLVRAFIAIGGLLVLALIGVLFAPFFIDWTAYRADFEREASRILGQRVVVHGEAAVRLLPFPSVTFTNVAVEGDSGAAPLMTVGRFRMDAELAPYLSGEIRIFSMQIERPELRLPIGRDGRLAFEPKGGVLPTSADVVLENVSVSNGTVLIEDAATRRRVTIDNLGGTFSARSLAGPLSGTGRASVAGRPLLFQIASGAFEPAKGLPLKLTIDDRSANLVGVADGIVTVPDGVPRLEGTLRLATANADTLDDKKERPPAVPDALPPFDLTGKLALTPRALDVSELRISAGSGEKPYVLTGAGSLAFDRLPRFRVALKGEQVDIDALGADERPREGSIGFDRRLETARRVLASVPHPRLPGTVKLELPVIVAGDTTIRDLAVSASPTDSGWSVETFSADFPGRTRLAASGILNLADSPSFTGNLLMAARQPSGFADWLTGAVEPAIRALPQAGFSADVALSRERQRFDNLEINLGGDTLRGRLQRSGPAGRRSLDADLSGGRLDLDAFVALSRLFTGETDSVAQARRGSLKMSAGPLLYAGARADRVDADLGYDGSALLIRRLQLKGLAGSDLDASGSLQDVTADMRGRIDLALRSADPTSLIELLQARLPPSPALGFLRARAGLIGPLDIKGVVGTSPGESGARPTLHIDVGGKAAATDLKLSMLLGNGIYAGGSKGQFGLDVSLQSPKPTELIAQLGLETLPVSTPSPLQATLSLAAGPAGPVAASAALRAPGTEFSGEGTLDVAASGLNGAQIAIAGKSVDAAPWLLATGTAFGAPAESGLPATIKGALSYDGASLRLDEAEANLDGIDIAASLEKTGAGPVTGDVSVSELSLPWLASLVYGSAPRTTDGPQTWPATPFSVPLFTGSVALDVTADRLDLADDAAVGSASAHIENAGGTLRISDIRGAIGGGYGTGSLRFRNADGVGGFAAEADLQGLDLGTLAISGFTLTDETETADQPATGASLGLTGTMDAKFRLDATGQSYRAMVAAMTGAGSIRVSEASAAGVKPGLLPFALRGADAQGFEVSPENVARVVAQFNQGGAYPIPDAASDFAVTGGVARFPATRIERPGEQATAQGSIDLRTMRADGSARLDYDPGADAVEGAVPSVEYALAGPIGRPSVRMNVQPLANFLSVRALQREQARAEAMQNALQEKLRLRRETRFYRWRADRRIAAEAAAAAGEAIRLRYIEEKRTRAERAAALAREAAERARREEQKRRERQGEASPAPASRALPDLDLDALPTLPGPPSISGDANPVLPGVRSPFDFP